MQKLVEVQKRVQSTSKVGSEASEDREGAQRKNGFSRPIRFRAVKGRTESTQEAPGGGEEAAAGNAMQS